jgi:hypothetical protein
MTAGDLIRRELENGASELGLAKRLAGTSDDGDAEVKRWRYIVRRAGSGSEPQATNVAQIARVFKVKAGKLERRPQARQLGRQAELEAEVLRLAGDVKRLAHRVSALERRAQRESQVRAKAAKS